MTSGVDTFEEWLQALDAWDFVIVVLFPLLIFALRHQLSRVFTAGLATALELFGLKVDDVVREGVRAPMSGFVVMISVYLGISSLDHSPQLAEPLQRLLKSALILFLFWLINQTCQLLLDHWNRDGLKEDYLQGTWLKQILKLVLIVLMLVVVFKVWGIDLGPALTGLGIAGAAVALGAQDLIRNLIAGFNNAGEQRFRRGEWIRLQNGLEGIVEKMDLRSTIVRRFDKGTVHVPNAELANSSLINLSRRTARRINWEIRLTHDTSSDTLELICDQIKGYLESSDLFVEATQANLFVTVFGFESSSIVVLVDCFVASNERTGELNARHHLSLEIKRIVESAGARFAYPTRTIYGQTAASTGGVVDVSE